MTRLFAAGLAGAMLVASVAQAHGPVRLRTEHSVVLNATPDEVWQAIGKFEDMGWHPAVASTEITGDGSVDVPEVSTRVLHLNADSGDPTITEKLIGFDADKRSYKYMIEAVDVAVLPVTNYSSTLQVKDKDGKAEVVWKAGFYRGFPNNDPPPNLNDETAEAAVNAIYQAGIEALSERFGKAE
ncbi:MAG: SRPBCC family protein [Paracoccus sp. (in: a-proteobacteria)]|uniref:SRPBCC family protein n=1 Tax=Paracoccus sp. TaxID=267 RepID=UPI0026DEBFBB|nr:SRPBCC family protein [Paracoccus sp. (in: a-proteobacteria)]MDO5612569.1 SRPBCC family protein [Paracoccus sp. (in: a-proteobacteria)]